MKLHFEDNLDYQLEAIDAVVDLFKGQEDSRSEFTVVLAEHAQRSIKMGQAENEKGFGNQLRLVDEEMLANLRAVQLRHGLPPSEELAANDYNFTVEMETGTGKTYVYLRTIMELHKQYGFTKFVIVVPSVPIKEGVYKTLQITREHFESLYPMAKGYEYFLYDSANLSPIRGFATSSNIQIMVTTVGAINKKDVNRLYKSHEDLNDDRPIELIQATRPILIVDEPQSVDGGLKGAGKEALDRMHPLCTLRYSATHVDKHHMVYRLDAVDAYNRNLVKGIEVASLEVEGAHNKPYVRLVSTHNQRGSVLAKIELDCLSRSERTVKRQVITVEDGDSLDELTKRDIYEGMSIGTITCGKNNESMELRAPNQELPPLRPGDTFGAVHPDDIIRLMLRRTIKEHLDKESQFARQEKPIKVLSLFFIDRVEFYRKSDGTKGKYALMFEEEYRRLAKLPDYQNLFYQVDLDTAANEVHDGYFSVDKNNKKVWDEFDLDEKGEIKSNQRSREQAERSYNLIMKDKEKLLSFETPLKFIFSHSALKEGWDNPNVFQICSLREMGSDRERRQTLGRGLRLCVLSDGKEKGRRIKDKDVNTLTVIATENFEQFAENLQKEIEKDTGIIFGVVEKHQFAAIQTLDEQGNPTPLGVAQSEQIYTFLKEQGFVDNKGKIQDSLRAAIKVGTFQLPEPFQEQQKPVEDLLKKLAKNLEIKNADERKTIRTRQAVLHSDEFKALWDRIKYKTTYRVYFDNDALVSECAKALRDAPPITKTRARFIKADIAVDKGGVTGNQTSTSAFNTVSEVGIDLPDILTELQNKTQLKRGTLVDILLQSSRLEDFKRNPQQFLEIASEAINRSKRYQLVDGVRYRRLGDQEYYAQELFEHEELKGYLKNTLAAQKSVHEMIIYDSQGVEESFARSLEENEAVKIYAKLPGWFKVPTPLGDYNPDWAVLIEQQGEERLYFVVETKGSIWLSDLRHQEGGKIACGKRHFQEIATLMENPAQYVQAKTLNEVMSYAD